MKLSFAVAAAVAAITLAAPPALAGAPEKQDAHDQHVIRFFLNHPKLASTPAGIRAMLRVLAHQQTRLRSLQDARAARTLPDVRDWVGAVRAVQRVYPGSEAWLLRCSASEGGHGIFVYHGGGTTYPGYDLPGGWMQYFESTFWGDFHAALSDARAHRFFVPASAASWHSPLGQALAGGWAYYHARPSGKWTGGGCW